VTVGLRRRRGSPWDRGRKAAEGSKKRCVGASKPCARMVTRKAQVASGGRGARKFAAAAAVIACVVLQAVVTRRVGTRRAMVIR
jgi:hypothetical protein